MAEHTCTVAWERGSADFVDRRYSRAHTWTFDGGAVVRGSPSPHIVPPPGSDPAAVDPEEAFVASLSSCHMLWFLDLAARRGYRIDRYVDHAVGTMGRNASAKLAMTRVVLRPAVTFGPGPQPDAGILNALHHEAHAQCFIANSVTTDVVCEPVVS
jgi:organic hydroperoxide reductase OsmC/OhrA